MKSLSYGIALGLVLAGIVHISIILLIPAYATNDAWAKLSGISNTWQFIDISSGRSAGQETAPDKLLPSADPQFRIAACRFNLGEAAIHVRAVGSLPFWSAAVFDRQGNNIYSLNDRTAVGRQLDLVVVNPIQMSIIRQNPPDSLESAVLVEAEIKEGIVLIRALVPDDSWSALLGNYLSEARCDRYPV